MKKLLLILLFCGCHQLERSEKYSNVQVTKTAEQTNAKTQNIRISQDKIDEVVEKAIQENSVKELPSVKPLTDQTRSDSIIIDSMVVDLVNILKEKEIQLSEKDKLLKEKDEKIKELQDQNSFKNKLPWILGGLGTIVVALGLLFGRHKITAAGLAIGGSSFGVITYYHILEKLLPLMLIVCVGFILFTLNFYRQERALTREKE